MAKPRLTNYAVRCCRSSVVKAIMVMPVCAADILKWKSVQNVDRVQPSLM